MRHRKLVTVVAFAAATAVGCIVVRNLRQRGKPEKQEPKRRTTKQSDGPTTGTGRTTEQTDRAIFNDIKAGQDGVKQPAARNASATGLIAAFRPVEQLPASSAVASSLASSAGSNASDRQAADDLLDLRFYVDALLLRAKVLRLELPAHRPEDAYEKDSAACAFSLEGEVTAVADEEASAPHDAAPVNMATPLPSWPDLTTGNARVPTSESMPGQQSQLQRQHSPDSSAAASAVAAAITPDAEGSMSSTDVSTQSSTTAVTLIQAEQAVGEAESLTSTGDAGPQVQGPPVDRATQSVSATQAVLPTSDTNFQQQDAAAIQPLDLSNASADVVDDRQSVTDSQAHASAEEVASRVPDATADASPLVHGRATVAHAALPNPPAEDAESAPADAASAEAAAAAEARMVSDAAMASWWQDQEDSMIAGLLQSVNSGSALQAETDTLQAEPDQLFFIGTSDQTPSGLSYEEDMNQRLFDQTVANSLGEYACVGDKVPLEPRAGVDKDSPHGRLPHKVSFVRSILGDGNCFCRAELAAIVEGLCHDPQPAHIAALSDAFTNQRWALESCPIVDDETKAIAVQGHNFLQDMLQGISRPGNTWQDMLVFLNQLDLDQAMVQFLRAITARELWANKPEYDCSVAGIDAYK
ncbi:TPA: hypothetical protein ACH3X3_004558 [Trebouxia sp. C0006]